MLVWFSPARFSVSGFPVADSSHDGEEHSLLLWFCSASVTDVQGSCYFSTEPETCGRAYLSERRLLSVYSRPPAGVWSALPGRDVAASWGAEGDVPSPASPAALPQLFAAPPVRDKCLRAAAFLRVPSRNSSRAQRWLKLARAWVTFCEHKHKRGHEPLCPAVLPPWHSCPLPKPLRQQQPPAPAVHTHSPVPSRGSGRWLQVSSSSCSLPRHAAPRPPMGLARRSSCGNTHERSAQRQELGLGKVHRPPFSRV